MKKELTSIQVSKEFKEVLRRDKLESESYEDHIKKLRNSSLSIDKKDTKNIYRKEIIAPKVESIEPRGNIKINRREFSIPEREIEKLKEKERELLDPILTAPIIKSDITINRND